MYQGIYIGLGGSGIKTLAKLKAKIYQYYKTENKIFDGLGLNPLTDFTNQTSFIFIDTDSVEIEKINSNESLICLLDGNSPIALHEKIDIGNTIPAEVLGHANNYVGDHNTRLKSWMILEHEGRHRPIHSNLSNGAGAMRMDGRTALFEHYAVIKNVIENAIAKLSGLSTFDNSNINIISGTNGGTGSALLLDISFLVNRIFLKQSQVFPNVKLALFAPQPFNNLNKQIENYPLNSFATFWEINAFKIGANNPGLMNQFFVNAF